MPCLRNRLHRACLSAGFLASAGLLPASAFEPVRLGIDGDYYEGESLQVRLSMPESSGDFRLFLVDPKGSALPLLPNEFETATVADPGPRLRVFPRPSLAYEIRLARPGPHHLVSVHGIRDRLGGVVWPTAIPVGEGSPLTLFYASLRDAGQLRTMDQTAVSSLRFAVSAGTRPEAERLPLRDGLVDGPGNPRFSPGETRLAALDEVRKLERWAELLRSPAHRHQSFLVEAHCRSAGSRTENLRLSEERAEEIVRYLVERCAVPAERLVGIGKGDFEPLPDEEDLSSPAHERVVLALDESASRQSLKP